LELVQGHIIGTGAIIAIVVLTGVATTGITAIINK
jgi:hypothetical protein